MIVADGQRRAKFKVGDKVTSDNVAAGGTGTVVSISQESGRVWVKWPNIEHPSLQSPESLQTTPEPATLLKELL